VELFQLREQFGCRDPRRRRPGRSKPKDDGQVAQFLEVLSVREGDPVRL